MRMVGFSSLELLISPVVDLSTFLVELLVWHMRWFLAREVDMVRSTSIRLTTSRLSSWEQSLSTLVGSASMEGPH